MNNLIGLNVTEISMSKKNVDIFFDLIYYLFEQIDISLTNEIKILNKFYDCEINKEYKQKSKFSTIF